MTPTRGSFVTSNLVPRGRRYFGRVAGEPYPTAHFRVRKLVSARLQGSKVKPNTVPKGPWVTVQFFDLGYYEVPVAWLREAGAPKPNTDKLQKRRKRK